MDVLERSERVLPAERWERFKVGYAPREGRNGWAIRSFDIPRDDWGRLSSIVMEGVERDPGYGTGFTRIVHNGELWMSDTRAEIIEHFPVFNQMFWVSAIPDSRLLVNGLGLGMVVKAALHYGMSHIDVVEIDPDVIDLIAPEFAAHPEVEIHQGDAYTYRFPPGTRWDLAWHDIWPSIDEDNLPGMMRLHRRYGGRVAWQGSWQRETCERMRQEMRRIYRR